MEAIESVLKSMSEASILSNDLETDEIHLPQLNRDYQQTMNLISLLIHSFSSDANILSSHLNFMQSVNAYLEKLGYILYAKTQNQVYEGDDAQEWGNVTESAGALQKALRDKLISLRD